MKITSALLFFGIFAYASADPLEECRNVAINIASEKSHLELKDPKRKGKDHDNQYIDMTVFFQEINTEFALARAPYDKEVDADEFKRFCSAVSFGAHCGPIFFRRTLNNVPDKNADGNYFNVPLANTFTMDVETWTYNLRDGIPAYVKMSATLIDDRDLIFQAKKETIQFYDLASKVPITDVPEKILNAFSQPFAMHEIIFADEKKTKIAATVSITCRETHAWAAYDMKLVNEHKQGTFGKDIEKSLYYLDKELHNKDEKKNDYDYERIQSISTVYPKAYHLWEKPQA